MLSKMFENRFNAEKAIKLIAGIMLAASLVLAGIAVPVALIMGIVRNRLWIISWIIIGVALFNLLVNVIMTPFLWGFGDLIGNTKRLTINNNNAHIKTNDIDDLPEI